MVLYLKSEAKELALTVTDFFFRIKKNQAATSFLGLSRQYEKS
jgi:hypothetical protein